ncbi:angiopoietin-related protein 7-like [Pecten maximus]|uniref:angiopoietin-related protein 7-like n=1 Tax=Pecten maximus TaxID=6579 RepID=UPI001458EEC2|nr:angiopoietin-related protein 7-like [Pecten maximus]
MWELKTVHDVRTLRADSDLEVVAVSSILCVVTALEYNRSTASYNESSQQCFLHESNSEKDMVDGIGVLYLQGDIQTNAILSHGDDIGVDGGGGVGSGGDGDIKSCGDLNPSSLSGVYRISSVPGNSFDVYCDMDSDGGPWTVIQNRKSKEVDFYRNWDQYKHGFGDLQGNFWLGNDHIHTLTKTPCILRVQLLSWSGSFGYAEYSIFQVSSEVHDYKLLINGYRGNISDALRKNNGWPFSTKDKDNDGTKYIDCVKNRRGPWWHETCTHANPNGLYEPSTFKQSMHWLDFYTNIDNGRMRETRLMLKRP